MAWEETTMPAWMVVLTLLLMLAYSAAQVRFLHLMNIKAYRPALRLISISSLLVVAYSVWFIWSWLGLPPNT